DVASDPAVRGQGYIRRLLSLAHDRNRSSGYDLAMLFTRSPWIYSGSAEFTALPNWWLDIDPRRVQATDERWIVEAVDPPRHVPELRQVYEQYGRERPGYPVRGDGFWTNAAGLTDPGWTRLARRPGREVAAYLRMRRAPDGRVMIREF